MSSNSEPYEKASEAAIKFRYVSSSSEPKETAIQNERAARGRYIRIGASDAPESGQKKKFSPKDVKKIRKIKMSFSTRLIPRFFLITRRFCYIFPFALSI